MAPIFEALRASMKGDVLVPGDAGYKDSIARWSAACVKRAGAVVMPTSAEEVSKTILFANDHGMPFTACCGGHTTSGTSSVGPEGLVVDLRRMRSVSVDPAARTVSFGGGCTWADVDDALAAHGLATPGGTVSHTGVGGLILGGGFGVLSGRHGLTVDCLLEVELVLADGSVVVASEESEPDLFWAARGAGISFGVATRFTSRAFPQGNDVWAGPMVFSPDKLDAVVGAMNAFLERQDGDQAMVMAPGYSPAGVGGPERKKVLLVSVFHNGSAEDAERVFGPLLAVGPLVDMAAEMPYSRANKLMDHAMAHGKRWMFGAANVTGPLDAGVVREAAEMLWGYVDAHSSSEDGKQDLRDSMVAFELIPYEKNCAVAPSATSFGNRGRYFNVGVVMAWTDPRRDDEVRRFKRELERAVRARGFEGDSVGGDGVGQYNNYLDQPISAEDAFGANARRLRELKGRYDPLNRFDKLWKLAGPAKSVAKGQQAVRDQDQDVGVGVAGGALLAPV